MKAANALEQALESDETADDAVTAAANDVAAADDALNKAIDSEGRLAAAKDLADVNAKAAADALEVAITAESVRIVSEQAEALRVLVTLAADLANIAASAASTTSVAAKLTEVSVGEAVEEASPCNKQLHTNHTSCMWRPEPMLARTQTMPARGSFT